METKVENIVKTISAVLPEEKIEHEGDLLIEGDVGELAKVSVKNGTLTILGSIKKGAIVDCYDPDALTNNGINQGRWSSMQSGYTRVRYANQTSSFKNNKFIQNYINAELTDRLLNLTIDTPDILTIVQEGVAYKITPKSDSLYAQATVNGKTYSGKSIDVVDGTVFAHEAPSITISSKPKKPCKTIIYGHIEDSVVLQYDELHFAGNVGNNCTVKSKVGGFSANNIGDGCTINVLKEIKTAAVGKQSTITSSTESVKIGKIGSGSTIKASENITAGSVDFGSKLTSSCRSVEISGACGDKVEISASERVVCNEVGKNATIKSSCKSVKIGALGDDSTVKASESITVDSVGSGSELTSSCRKIEISGTCGDKVKISASDEVIGKAVGKNATIKSSCKSVKIGALGDDSTVKASESITVDSVGSGSELSSSCRSVKITGSCGNKVKINASDQVVCNDIGDNSTISSSCRSVTVNNLGDGVKIRASDNIVVNGFCPNTADLKSSCGKVKKTNPQAVRPNKKETSNTEVSVINIRKKQDLPQQHFFASKTEKGNIPALFLCPLTGKIMQSPTFFTLDGNTYEEQAIRPWLTFNRCSPNNQQIRMEDSQSVDQVLFPNPVIKKQIEEFKNEQPVEGIKFS